MVLPEIAVHLNNGLFGSKKANYDDSDLLLVSLASSSLLLLPLFFGYVCVCVFLCFLYSLLQYV
jgi:hypothetical protein